MICNLLLASVAASVAFMIMMDAVILALLLWIEVFCKIEHIVPPNMKHLDKDNDILAIDLCLLSSAMLWFQRLAEGHTNESYKCSIHWLASTDMRT